MKNKLFLTLSLLTAGLTQASFVDSAKFVLANPFVNMGRATISGCIALPVVALGSAYSYRNEILAAMDESMAHKMASQFGVKYPAKEVSKRDKLMNFAKTSFNTSKTFVANNKVATGAGLAAVVGLGLVYKYRKNIFGQAKKLETPKPVQLKKTIDSFGRSIAVPA